MLAVALRHVEQLDASWVPLQVLSEHVEVVILVPFVKAQAQLLIDLLQSCTSFCKQRHCVYSCWCCIGLEGSQRLLVHLLCHAVMHLEKMFNLAYTLC